ncbi:serpin family protein [Anaerobacillus sp. MEB173]|uniref:serpin family protein n=1 Tax=Anaerobacillus sp. MEB173 TaxID=3383345 RepID=UPI003F8E5C35
MYRDSKILLPIFIAVILLLIVGCSQKGNHDQSNSHSDGQLHYSNDDLDPRLAAANINFAFSLYKKLVEEDGEKNVFISPYSISAALAMTYNGADKETKEAMAETLSFQQLSLEDVNQSFKVLQNILEFGDPSVQLNIANSLWGREGRIFHKGFLQRNEEYFDAMITTLNFNDDEASDIINSWVKEKTEGKIEEIVDEYIDPNTVMFLINAIYFKGDWSKPFEESRTRPDTFHLLDGSSVQIPLMSSVGDYDYFKNHLFQSIRLPYGDEQIGMYVFLPSESITLEEFHHEFTEENWRTWLGQYETIAGEIQLPKFKLEYEKLLNELLKDLGMEIAFDDQQANFGQMGEIPPNLYIANVKHKTFLEVNEEGTEAAGVTSVEIVEESAPVYDFQMTVNRPFFIMVYDEATETILFMGTIVDPS